MLVHGGPAMQRTPRFSPDGSRILYISDAGGIENAWTSKPDGKDARQVTRETTNLVMAASWGPDADSVVVERIGGRYPERFASEIRLYDFGGGSRTLVPTPANRRDVAEPVVSRDGRYVYYTERLASEFEIYVDANHINYAIRRRELATGAVEELAEWLGRRARAAGVAGRAASCLCASREGQDGAVRHGSRETSPSARSSTGSTATCRPPTRRRPITIRTTAGSRTIATSRSGARVTSIAWTWIPAKLRKFRSAWRRSTASPSPLRFAQDLAPARLTVRAIRDLAPSPDGRTLVFTALARLWRKAWPGGHAARRSAAPTPSGFEPCVLGRRPAARLGRMERRTRRRARRRRQRTAAARARLRRAAASFASRASRRMAGASSIASRRPIRTWAARAPRPAFTGSASMAATTIFVAAGDRRPQFSPDGRRIYFIEMDLAGESPAEVLVSVTTEGLDRREHARTSDADTSELRPESGPALHRLSRSAAVLRDALARDWRAARCFGVSECRFRCGA